MTGLKYYVPTILLYACLVTAGIFVDDLGTVFDFMGGFCGSAI